jgi:hypothetical protein
LPSRAATVRSAGRDDARGACALLGSESGVGDVIHAIEEDEVEPVEAGEEAEPVEVKTPAKAVGERGRACG